MKKIRKLERQERLISEINRHPSILIRDLASMFGVSRETIRRDFDELSSQARLHRRYGGASLSPTGLVLSLETRKQLLRPEKELVAKLAYELIGEHEVIMLGSGATIIILAQEIATHNPNITIITNSLGAALSVGEANNVRVLLTAGELDHKEAFLWGHETTEFLDKFTVDATFLSCDGITPNGVMEVESRTAWVERAMVRNSRRTVVLLDHSKFGQTSFERVCELQDVDELVSDRPPDNGLSRVLNQAGIRVHAPSEMVDSDDMDSESNTEPDTSSASSS